MGFGSDHRPRLDRELDELERWGSSTPGAGSGQQFLATATASGLRRPALGPAWVAEGPMVPPAGPGSRYDPPTRVVLKSKPAGVKLIAKAFGNARPTSPRTPKPSRSASSRPTPREGASTPPTATTRLRLTRSCAAARRAPVPDGSFVSPLGAHGYVAVFAHKASAVVQLTPTTLDEACGHKSTALQLTGAFTATFDRQGSCSVSSVDGGTLSALFYSPGVGQVTLSMKRYHGPGTYQTGLDPPTGARRPVARRRGQVRRAGRRLVGR